MEKKAWNLPLFIEIDVALTHSGTVGKEEKHAGNANKMRNSLIP